MPVYRSPQDDNRLDDPSRSLPHRLHHLYGLAMRSSVSALALWLLVSTVCGCTNKNSASSSSLPESSRDGEPSGPAESEAERLMRGRKFIEYNCEFCHSPVGGSGGSFRPDVKDMGRLTTEE